MANYNINAVTRRVVYTGSAGVGPYAFSFEILVQTDVDVYFNATLLTLTTDYTVTINANGTGSVTLVTGTNVPTTPTASDQIAIVGARDIERTTDFVTAGELRAAALNEQLDGLTIFDQQLLELTDRALTAPITDPISINMTLPTRDSRKGKYLAFNETTGDPEAGATIADVATLASITDDIARLADIEDGTLATNAIQTTASNSSNITTVAGNISNVNTVAGNNTNISSVASNATNINTVAGDTTQINAVAGNATNINAVASNATNINSVAGNATNINTVAGDTTQINSVASNASNINTVAGSITNVNNVAGSITNVNTVATNIADVNNFADVYRIGSTDPTTSLDTGDLFFNTTSSSLKVYDGAAWTAGVTAGSGFLPTTGGSLTGNVTFTDNTKAFFGTGSDLEVFHNGSNSIINDAGTGELQIQVGGSTKLSTNSTGVYLTGDLTVDTNTLHVDSTNNRVGVGTASPAAKLHLGGSSNQTIQIEGASNTAYFGTNANRGDLFVNYDPTNGTIPNSGRSTAGIQLDGADGGSNIVFRTTNANNAASTERMRIDSSGVVRIGGQTGTLKLGNDGTYYADIEWEYANNELAFTANSVANFTFNSNGSERARIDSSGNLLVGKTSDSFSTVGSSYRANGSISATATANEVLDLNRLSTDGGIMRFFKDSTFVGSIGNSGAYMYLASQGPSARGVKITDNFIPATTTGANNDNVMDLGGASVRWDDVYATNGTIQTSDVNEKQDVAELDEAEKRVATAAKGLIRKFRWISSVEEKGDDARIHVGVIAQDLKAAFEAEGLDPGRYAMFISSTWWEADETYTDDDGVEQTRTNTYETAEEAPEGAVERTRLGVRYNQLLAFIIGAL